LTTSTFDELLLLLPATSSHTTRNQSRIDLPTCGHRRAAVTATRVYVVTAELRELVAA